MNLDVLGLEESLQNGLTYITVLQVDELFYDTCKSAEFFFSFYGLFVGDWVLVKNLPPSNSGKWGLQYSDPMRART